jgi:hypothetical protein
VFPEDGDDKTFLILKLATCPPLFFLPPVSCHLPLLSRVLTVVS